MTHHLVGGMFASTNLRQITLRIWNHFKRKMPINVHFVQFIEKFAIILRLYYLKIYIGTSKEDFPCKTIRLTR